MSGVIGQGATSSGNVSVRNEDLEQYAIGGMIYDYTLGRVRYRCHKYVFETGHNDNDMDNHQQTFVVKQTITGNCLVVAGGGGGGRNTNYAGGGGAGGFRAGDLTFNVGVTYDITIGSGGGSTIANHGDNDGQQGGQSKIVGSDITDLLCTGGGGGQGDLGVTGFAGGSGGGGTAVQAAGGEGISGQGHDGGFGACVGQGGSDSGSGGGGGAAQAGGHTAPNAASNSPGHGGSGCQNDYAGVCGQWYAAGGSGAGYYRGGMRSGIGGTGGGRRGMLHAKPQTGAGGGGSDSKGTFLNLGGFGGSGIVIIRYALPGQ